VWAPDLEISWLYPKPHQYHLRAFERPVKDRAEALAQVVYLSPECIVRTAGRDLSSTGAPAGSTLGP
jgi:hypothetical protein